LIGILKGAKEIQRCYGPDFFKETMIATANTEIKQFFCGYNEHVCWSSSQSLMLNLIFM